MDKSYLGNLKYNAGQDFNVIISNASFEDLQKFKDWASDSDHGGATNNGLGTNIKNSFIICSPQQDDAEVNISTDINKIEYYERNNKEGYQADGDDLISTSLLSTTKTTINKRDTGATDLIVTDHLGNLIRLTPPFSDIDTTYFDVNPGVVTENVGNTLYGGRALTFNKKYSKLLSDSSNTMSKLSVTYTPILSTINNNVEVEEEGQEKTYMDVPYSTIAYWYLDHVSNTKIWTTVSYNQSSESTEWTDLANSLGLNTEDGKETGSTYHAYGVSFINLLDNYYSLQQKYDDLSKKINDITSDTNANSLTYKVQYLTILLQSNVMYKADENMPTYIWTGNSKDYNKFIKSHNDDSNSYIFIHTTNK